MVNADSDMYCREPTGLDLISTLANRAVQRDTQGDADELLQAIRVVSSQTVECL